MSLRVQTATMAVPHKRERKSDRLFALGPLNAQYVWLDPEEYSFPSAGQAVVVFEARAENDIHLAFDPEAKQSKCIRPWESNRNAENIGEEAANNIRTSSLLYEVIIGGNQNHKSCIRIQGENVTEVVKQSSKDRSAGITDMYSFHKYWICINHGVVVVGRGGQPGSNEMMRAKARGPIVDPPVHLGLSTWNTPIRYRGIRILPLSAMESLKVDRVAPLSSLVAKALEDFISPKNAPDMMAFADIHNNTKLREFCFDYITENFDLVARHRPFCALSPEVVEEIVSSDRLNSKSELNVFRLCELRARECTRPDDIVKVLGKVRYPLIEEEVLLSSVLPAIRRHGVEALEHEVDEAIHLIRSTENAEPVCGTPQGLTTFEETFPLLFRRPIHMVELPFVKDGDENGVVWWLGTRCGTEPWENPVKNGEVDIKMSTPPSRYLKPDMFTSRTGNQAIMLTGRPPWVRLNLRTRRLICSCYTLRQDGNSSSFIRNWTVEASNDGEHWTEIKAHVNDSTLSFPSQHASWHLVGPRAQVAFQYWRFVMTGPSSCGDSKTFGLAGFELYGFLVDKTGDAGEYGSDLEYETGGELDDDDDDDDSMPNLDGL